MARRVNGPDNNEGDYSVNYGSNSLMEATRAVLTRVILGGEGRLYCAPSA